MSHEPILSKEAIWLPMHHSTSHRAFGVARKFIARFGKDVATARAIAIADRMRRVYAEGACNGGAPISYLKFYSDDLALIAFCGNEGEPR
ncbi:MAG: hypothetical protein ACRECU_05910 [Methylocella sp.]